VLTLEAVSRSWGCRRCGSKIFLDKID